jgi:ribosomal protein L13
MSNEKHTMSLAGKKYFFRKKKYFFRCEEMSEKKAKKTKKCEVVYTTVKGMLDRNEHSTVKAACEALALYSISFFIKTSTFCKVQV